MSLERDIREENIKEAKKQLRALTQDREFGTLEKLLHKDSQALISLQRSRRELDFGKANRKLVNEWFPVIKEEVDKFLEVEDISEPNIQYRPMQGISIVCYAIGGVIALGTVYGMMTNQISDFTYRIFMVAAGVFAFLGKAANYFINKDEYDGASKTMRIMGKTKADVVLSSSHEYTHHVQLIRSLQEKGNVKKLYYNSLDEGVARAAQRRVCKLYAERENNEAYNLKILDMTVGELKSVYKWICGFTGNPLKDNLLHVRTTRDGEEQLSIKKHGHPTEHAIGNAIYYVFDTVGMDHECEAIKKNTFPLTLPHYP